MNSREAGDRVSEWKQSERLDARDVAAQQDMLHLHVRYLPTKQCHVFNVVIPKNRNLVLIYSVTRVDDGQQSEMTEHSENETGDWEKWLHATTVSYTHQTLPPIYSV